MSAMKKAIRVNVKTTAHNAACCRILCNFFSRQTEVYFSRIPLSYWYLMNSQIRELRFLCFVSINLKLFALHAFGAVRHSSSLTQSCFPVGVAAPMAPIDSVIVAASFTFVLDFNAVPAFIHSPRSSVMHVVWGVGFKSRSAFYATKLFVF